MSDPSIKPLPPPSAEVTIKPPPLPARTASTPSLPFPLRPVSITSAKANEKLARPRTTLVAGSLIAVIIAVGVGGYVWQERSSKPASAEGGAAGTNQVREQQTRLGIDAPRLELDQQSKATASSDAQPGTPQVLPIDGPALAKLLLTDVVPGTEAERRAAISERLNKEEVGAESRLATMQAQKVMTAAGVDSASAASATAKIQEAVLQPSSANALETSLVQIEALSKPARGDRKAARSANDEGLRMLQEGRFEDAVAAFNRALSADPADVEVIGNLSLAYLKNGQLLETLRISALAVRLSPRRAGAWNQLALAHAQRGSDWQAVRSFVVLHALSNDQLKTRDYLSRTATENPDERVRHAAKNALLVIPEPMTR